MPHVHSMKTETISDKPADRWEYIEEYSFEEPLGDYQLLLNVPVGTNRVLGILKDRVDNSVELAACGNAPTLSP